MRKKLYVCLIGIVCLLGGCTRNEIHANTPTPTKKVESTPKPTEEIVITETPEAFNPEEWGVQENLVSEANSELKRAWIKFPEYAGVMKGTGKVSGQVLSVDERILIILDAQMGTDSPEVQDNKVENILPAYFVQTKDIIKAYRTVDHSNFEFSIADKELVTINEYEMCKCLGTHTYTVIEDGKNVEYSLAFVAYATKLKSNGAYVYWMVLDESKNQTLGDFIEEQALKMAKTLYDE